MYKQLIAFQLACLLAHAAGSARRANMSSAIEFDRTGRSAEAGELYGKLVSEAQTFRPADARTSETFNNAAAHAYFTGDYVQAESLYRRALGAFERASEDNNVKLALILANLAGVLRAQASYDEAESTALRAERLDPRSATGWSVVAEVYRAKGNLQAAEDAARKALENTVPSERDGKAHTLGAILSDEGHFQEALQLYNRSLEFQLNRKSVAAATTLANIAVVYIRRSEYAKAEHALSRAFEIWQSAGVQATAHMAAAVNNLAQIRKLQGRFSDAEPLYRRALAIWESCVGKHHPEYAKGLSNLADFYHAIGNDRAAEGLYSTASDILDETLGRNSKLTIAIRSRHADILNALGRHTDAHRLSMSPP